jgi:probable HAF family extracellular repeat protein
MRDRALASSCVLAALVAVLCLGLDVWPIAAQPAPTYAVTDLGTLGGDCRAMDFNLRGQIVGTCRAGTGPEQAFLYAGGVMTPLGTLGGSYSFANAVNQLGDVGGDAETAGGLQHACLWHGNSATDLGTLGGARSQANGINTRGQLVGWAYLASGTWHAFLFENGTMTDIGASFDGSSIATDIDEFGRVVGYHSGASGQWGFRWFGGAATDFASLGGSNSGANKINLFGDVAGWSSYAGNVARPVIFRGNAVVDLGSLGGQEGSAWGINDLGHAVGYSYTGDTKQHAFIYRGSNLYDLNDLIPTAAGIEMMAAPAIDDLGRIVGYGCSGGTVVERACTGGQIRAVLLTPTGGQSIQDLIDLIGQLNLPRGTENSLLAKLQNALKCADRANVACMCNSLSAFINEVRAQAGKALTQEDADLLIAAAEALMATLGCR